MATTLALLFAIAPAFAQHGHDEEKKQEGKAEIRIYLADKDKKPLDLKDVTASVVIEPKGGAKRTLKAELVTPKGTKQIGIGHGGEVREAEGGLHVEFVVHKPHDEKGHGEHQDEDATPYFKAEIGLQTYSCGMEGHPVADAPGKCPKCPMEMKARPAEFTAVVIFKVKGETRNAKGFEYPSSMPGTYPAAVAKAEGYLKEIRSLIDKGDLDKVHGVAEKISQICERLPGIAAKDHRAEIEKICKETIALFKEIDDAADAGKKAETEAAYKKYAEKIAALKKHAKMEEEHHK